MITVITPVYNAGKHIEGCIENVIGQQCPCIEHLIVDGGSTDGTVDVIERYAERYPHIRWISDKDRGQSDAMNKGIALAKGEILGFLNADDDYEPGVLNRVADLFRTLPEPTLAVANCNVWQADGTLLLVVRPSRLKFHQLLLGPALNLFPVNPTEYFYHKSLHREIGPYNVDDHYSMDLDFLLRAVRVANCRYVDETWGNFRMLPESKTVQSQQTGNLTQRDQVYRRYRQELPWWFRKCFWLYKSTQAVLFAASYLGKPGAVWRAIVRRLPGSAAK